MAQLENEGIRCFLFDENAINVKHILNYQIGGIKLKIDEKDFDLAKEIHDATHKKPYTNEDGQIITCPNCNSPEVYLGTSQAKGLKAIFEVLILLVLSIVPNLKKAGFQCKSCGEQFKV